MFRRPSETIHPTEIEKNSVKASYDLAARRYDPFDDSDLARNLRIAKRESHYLLAI